MGMFKDVNVAYLYVNDLAAARKWYEDVLGWPLVFGAVEMGWFEYGVEGATHVALNQVQPGSLKPGAGGTTMVFTVDDADVVHAVLKGRGVRVDEMQVIPGTVKIGTFYDPDGNRLQFASNLAGT